MIRRFVIATAAMIVLVAGAMTGTASADSCTNDEDPPRECVEMIQGAPERVGDFVRDRLPVLPPQQCVVTPDITVCP